MQQPEKLEIRRHSDAAGITTLTFEFIRQNFRQLGKMTGFLVAPIGLVAVGLFSVYFSSMMESGTTDPAAILGFAGSILLALIFYLLGMVLLTSAVNQSMILYMERGPGGYTFAELRTASFKHFPRMLGTYLVIIIMIYGVLTVLGFFAIFLPFVIFAVYAVMIYMGVGLSLVTSIRSREPAGIGGAISRSFNLIKGRWWRTFRVYALIEIIIYGLSYSLIFPVVFLFAIYQIIGGTMPTSYSAIYGMFSTIVTVSLGISYLLQVVFLVAVNLHYYSLMEEAEGVGLLEKVETIGEERTIQDTIGEAI